MVIFIINYLIVKRFLIRPINEVLTWREDEIAGAEKVYEESLARFNAATSEMETRIHSAKREATGIREGYRGEANTRRNEVIERVRKEAETISRSADEQLARDIAAAREQIVRESDSLARLAAERIIGRKLS
jgi:F-type H+-transporting ATPase subunit b